MPTFDILVVGSGGGPDESNLSAYLLKLSDADWQDGIIGLEAGSGIGTLHRILRRNPSLLGSATYTASEIYSFIECFLISHAHLDHISGLILSTGSLSGVRKCVYATEETLDDISSVFNDRLWPNLASFEERDEMYKLYLRSLHGQYYTKIHSSISVLSLPLSHGVSVKSPHEPVLSTAFFLRHDPTQREILFFGDVEPDALALKPLNLTIWRMAAPKIPHSLSAIFIECSWTLERSDDMLFGHLNPTHLVNELLVLATEVWKARTSQGVGRSQQKRLKVIASETSHSSPTSKELRGVLDGLSVYIIHCKSDLTSDRPVRSVIEEQVKDLVQKAGLGARICTVEQGSLIHI